MLFSQFYDASVPQTKWETCIEHHSQRETKKKCCSYEWVEYAHTCTDGWPLASHSRHKRNENNKKKSWYTTNEKKKQNEMMECTEEADSGDDVFGLAHQMINSIFRSIQLICFVVIQMHNNNSTVDSTIDRWLFFELNILANKFQLYIRTRHTIPLIRTTRTKTESDKIDLRC